MKKSYVILIVCLAIVIGSPIAYYYGYSLPKLEREKFEYQKKLDQEEKDKKTQEEYDKRLAEENRKENYNNCINQADIEYNANFERYCELGYSQCKDLVDDWNRSLDGYSTLGDMRKTYAECEKFKYKDGQCSMYNNIGEKRDAEYQAALDRCEKMYN